MKQSGTDTQNNREELHRYFLRIPCLISSWFLGVWAIFALASFLFPENIMRTCKADITVTTHHIRIATTQAPWSETAKLTLPWQHTNKQIVWDLRRNQRVDIIITTQVKIAPTQRRWSCCTQHDKLRSSLLTQQRADICLYVTNRDDIDFTPWHIRNRMFTGHMLWHQREIFANTSC